jgi:hypothetical protein
VFYSPVTAVRRVRVVGAKPYDYERIVQHIQTIQKIPYVKLNLRRLETLLLANGEIRSVKLYSNPFGSAGITIESRVAVAKIMNTPSLYLSEDGVLFTPNASVTKAISLWVPTDFYDGNLCLGGRWEAQKMALFCRKLSRTMFSDRWDVAINAGGVICLRRQGQSTIIFGFQEKADEKMSQVERIIRQYPGVLFEAKAINVMVPSHPVLVPIKQEKINEPVQ